MPYVADRVQETTTTIGTGTISLGGAVSGYQTFFNGLGAGVIKTYYLVVSGVAWETGKGFFNSATNTLTRDTVFDSSLMDSNGIPLIISLSGTSSVFCTMPAEAVDDSLMGHQIAQVRGMAMP